MNVPSNVRFMAIMADAEHQADVVKLIPVTTNERAIGLMGAWRRDLGRFPFLVIAGHLRRRDGAIVGGLAANWDDAILLHRFAVERLDEIARTGAGFTSLWILLLEESRRESVEELIAMSQPVEGHA